MRIRGAKKGHRGLESNLKHNTAIHYHSVGVAEWGLGTKLISISTTEHCLIPLFLLFLLLLVLRTRKLD